MKLPSIAICGLLRSGKDEVARILTEKYGYVRFAFGDGVRDVCKRLFPDQFTDAAGNAVKPRSLLRGVAEAMRAFERDVWVRQCFEEITEEALCYSDPAEMRAVITDLRQPHEYDRCHAEGFVIIRVKAPSALRIHRAATGGDVFNLSDLTHETEMYSDTFDVDYEIVNDGTLDDLNAKVDAMMAEITERAC